MTYSAAAVFLGGLAMASIAHGESLADNLAHVSAGAETADVNNDLAMSFSTGDQGPALDSATLLMSGSADSVAGLALHADGGLEPGAFIVDLDPPPVLPAELDLATFTSDGSVHLDPDTTYWLVLTAHVGTLSWGWTEDDDGAGEGFERTWATMDHDSGLWWCQDRYALQIGVVVDDVIKDCPADTDGNGSVDANDVLAVIAQWGQAGGTADVNQDGIVNVNDLLDVVNAWGPC